MRGIAQAVLDHVDHGTHLRAFAQHARGLVHQQRLAWADGAGVHHRQLKPTGAAGILARLEALGRSAHHRAGGVAVEVAT